MNIVIGKFHCYELEGRILMAKYYNFYCSVHVA